MSLYRKKNKKILDIVRREEYRRRLEQYETWGHVGGRLYSISKIVYTLAFVFVLVIDLAYLMGSWLWINDAAHAGSSYDPVKLAITRNAVFIVLTMTLLLIAAFVLLLKKKMLPFLLFTWIPGILLAVHFYEDLSTQISENGISIYLIRHGIALLLLLIFSVVLFVIGLRERRAETAAYNRLVAKIYASRTGDGKMFTDEEWEEILDRYDGEPDRPLKRSQKAKRRKADEDDGDIDEPEDSADEE